MSLRSNLIKRRRRKGLSPVISTVILSAVVLTVGGSIWYYAQGAASIIAQDYIDGVLTLKDEAAERFTVERVSNNSDCTQLYLWVYNYGNVNITADAYAYIGNSTYSTDTNSPFTVGSGDVELVNITVEAQSGDEITIKVHSRRQNNAYSTYIVP
ncbi:MAG: hypothetical protein PVH79_01100 [Candidatus Bathyarchaeota archaeon]|jgi:flagellin-like protein